MPRNTAAAPGRARRAVHIALPDGGGVLVRRLSRDASGFSGSKVYFLENTETGRIKIGRTVNDPRTRRSGVQVGSDARVRLIGWLPESEHSEGALHALFAAHAYRGEWFDGAIRPEVEKFLAAVTWTPEAEEVRKTRRAIQLRRDPQEAAKAAADQKRSAARMAECMARVNAVLPGLFPSRAS